MSMTAFPSVTRFSMESNLHEYANQSRKIEQFTDVNIQSGVISFPAHRIVLACYSQFFERLFQSPMREQYQGTVELNKLDGECVKMLVDFMYTRSITIEYKHVFNLLQAAHFLQLNELCEFCFDYLITVITVDNWASVLSVCHLYESKLLYKHLCLFIGKNLNDIAQTKSFNELSFKDLTDVLSILKDQEVSACNAILSWVGHDKKGREKEFASLLLLVDLHRLPHDYLEDVVAINSLVKENVVCLNAVMAALTKQFKDMRRTQKIKSKLISIGGSDKETYCKVMEVFNTGTSQHVYPDLPVPQIHIQSKSVKFKKCIYNIGGSSINKKSFRSIVSNNVFCLDLQKSEMEWKEFPSMHENRCCMGAAVFKDCLIVAGGKSYDALILNTSEIYIPALKKWQQIGKMNHRRENFELVTCGDYVYAIGGSNGEEDLSAVERLGDLNGDWEKVAEMQSTRNSFAATSFQGKIYVFGGLFECDEHIEGLPLSWQYETLQSVELYNPDVNQWSFVKDMNHKRYEFAASVLQEKIYIVGGVNFEKFVRVIESYDPSTNEWSFVDEYEQGLSYHSLVAL